MKYLCYDAALNGEYTLIQLLQHYPSYLSLFYGTDDERIWDAAPYLFEVNNDFYDLRNTSPLVHLDHCIVFETDEPKEEIVKFLQRYFYKTNAESPCYYRLWDARVLLEDFCGWSNEDQLLFFECFDCFYTENKDPYYFDKWQRGPGNRLKAEQLLKAAVLPDRVAITEKPADMAGEPLTGKTTGTPVAGTAITASSENEQQAEEPPKRRRFFIE